MEFLFSNIWSKKLFYLYYYWYYLYYLYYLCHLHYLNYLYHLYECDLICALLILYVKKILTFCIIANLFVGFNAAYLLFFDWTMYALFMLSFFVWYIFFVFFIKYCKWNVRVICFKFGGYHVNKIVLFLEWF